MTVIIDGTTGISAVQAGAVTTSDLPAGTVLQVVNATYSTSVSNSTGTYADTGLTASITPTSASSKILVFVNQADIYKGTNDTSCRIQLQRNGALIVQFALFAAGTGTTTLNINGSVGTTYLDSPATTSAVTYKTQFASSSSNAVVTAQFGNSTSTITLMEIAA